jgi:hypothetical protein
MKETCDHLRFIQVTPSPHHRDRFAQSSDKQPEGELVSIPIERDLHDDGAAPYVKRKHMQMF